ncbi:unnamed protein product [Clavelina lepadiformis]|uniref:Protein sleepless n=1 Tax=Clavelina lepadiformis TaxID=159417 RepID=A0ABP0GWB8_CLALP
MAKWIKSTFVIGGILIILFVVSEGDGLECNTCASSKAKRANDGGGCDDGGGGGKRKRSVGCGTIVLLQCPAAVTHCYTKTTQPANTSDDVPCTTVERGCNDMSFTDGCSVQDKIETCIYLCQEDGCNGSSSPGAQLWIAILPLISIIWAIMTK